MWKRNSSKTGRGRCAEVLLEMKTEVEAAKALGQQELDLGDEFLLGEEHDGERDAMQGECWKETPYRFGKAPAQRRDGPPRLQGARLEARYGRDRE